MTRKKPGEDLRIIIWQTECMENGPAKCSALEELVRRADVAQDVEAGYHARMALIDAATFSGYPDKAIVAFSWCLSQSDKQPEKFPEHDRLWKYKWITNSLAKFPQISKGQMDEMLEDMRVRYERSGIGPRAVHMVRWKLAMKMGDKATAKKSYAEWRKLPRDWMSDCAACEQDELVNYATLRGKDEEAMQQAEPILNGRLRCSEVPHITYGRLLIPLVRLERLEEAAKLHRTGYRLVTKNAGLLDSLAEHLLFLAVTENLAKGTKVFEKYLPWSFEVTNLNDRFDFFLASRFLFERLVKAGSSSLKLRLPKAFPPYQEQGRYEVADLDAWFGQETADLAKEFDRRNENDHYSRRIKDLKKLHVLATPYPLK